MPYIIDGHNLIPKIPGLSLKLIDDENVLITMLQDFCRRKRKDAEVFFDNAPPAQVRKQRYGKVTAHFISQGSTADQAIHRRLLQLAGESPNWIVVSSDRAVQSAARRVRAQLISSEAFAKQLILKDISTGSGEDFHPEPTEEEIEEWLHIFKDRDTRSRDKKRSV